MAVGIYSTKADVDMRVGGLAQSLRANLVAMGDVKLWLDAKSDPELADFGYAAGDIATLRSAVTDLDQLRQVYLGLATRTPAYDYRTFAKLLG